MRVNYAIVLVSDMKRSVTFYRDVLGLPLKFETPGWTEFSTDGATLEQFTFRSSAMLYKSLCCWKSKEAFHEGVFNGLAWARVGGL